MSLGCNNFPPENFKFSFSLVITPGESSADSAQGKLYIYKAESNNFIIKVLLSGYVLVDGSENRNIKKNFSYLFMWEQQKNRHPPPPTPTPPP